MHDVCRRVYSPEGVAPACKTGMSGNTEPKIMETTICLNSKVNGKQPSLGDRVYDVNGVSTTIATSPFFTGCIAEPIIGAIRGRSPAEPASKNTEQRLEMRDGSYSNALTGVSKDNVVIYNCRIRKLTPLECWRLMGFNDSDFLHVVYSPDIPLDLVERLKKRILKKHEWKRLWPFMRRQQISDSQLYKQAGNSIVVNVLEAIFKQML